MKVLMCASEGVPFAKTGGLADVVGALSKTLKDNNCDVRIIMPYYKKMKEKKIGTYLGYTFIDIGSNREYVGVFHENHDGVDYYFIDNEKYFCRDLTYGYYDDGERFAFFDFAVLEALKIIDFFPDIIHVNDWQTGLVPHILKYNYGWDSKYNRIKTVFSIHNIQYQGIFPKNMMAIMPVMYTDEIEFAGNINFMKAAIMEANAITTVSPSYREEILTEEYSYGLHSVLGARYDDFYGILNGIDTVRYDPLTDKDIGYHYSSSNFLISKKANKDALLKEFGLGTEDVPLFGLVSRLVEQKGIDLFAPIMDDIMKHSNAKFIFLGSGHKCYEDMLKEFENKYPNRIKAYIGYSDPIAQRIYAGCDVFLMPSKFEPCGLGQMIAMRYGALPLVRETGGLKDSVEAFNKYTGEGTGFTFTGYDSNSFKEVIYLAIGLYNDYRIDFTHLVQEAMNRDFSWNNSALKYMELYKKLLGGGNK